MSEFHESAADVCALLQVLESALLDPAVRRDREKVAALLAEDFLEFGSSGRIWTREQTLELLATENYQAPAMEDFQCRMVAGEVALVTYKTVRVDAKTGEKACVLRSSVWTSISGEWRVRFHQGTRTL